MNAEQLNQMLEGVQAYGELLGGLRNQLIAQGYSVEMAELMTLEILKAQHRGEQK